MTGVAHITAAELQIALGDLAVARKEIEQGERILRGIKNMLEIGVLLCVRGQIDLLTDNRDAARSALEEAEAIGVKMKAPPMSELARGIEKLRIAMEDSNAREH